MPRSIRALAVAMAAVMPLAATQEPTLQAEQDPFTVATFCTPYPQNTRPAIVVRNGAELQNALDDAKGGATFRPAVPDSSFMLRNRAMPDGEWIVVRSASRAFDTGGQIPPNRRVTPA